MKNTLPLAVATLVLAGCGRQAASPSVPPPPAMPIAEMQAQFAEQRRQAEAEQQRFAALERRRRSFVGVEFARIDDDGRVCVKLTNLTGKAIDDIRGGIHAKDLDGNHLASAGYTTAVPGEIFLAVGASHEQRAFVSARPQLVERLQQDPQSVVFSFAALALTYGDGSQESGIDL